MDDFYYIKVYGTDSKGNPNWLYMSHGDGKYYLNEYGIGNCGWKKEVAENFIRDICPEGILEKMDLKNATKENLNKEKYNDITKKIFLKAKLRAKILERKSNR